MLPDSYRERFLEAVNQLLWRQWSNLGVPGVGHPHDRIIIDPEALLLFSTVFARYDPRLFDEILNWLNQYGKVINIQRLRNLCRFGRDESKFGDGPTLAALAHHLGDKSIYRKWNKIGELVTYYTKEASPYEALFLNPDGSPFPEPTSPDPGFKEFRLLRGRYEPRENTTKYDIFSPSTLLIKLRYLFGVNARADVICYLFTRDSAHPAEIARMTGYFKKTIQDCLNEMGQTDHVDSFEKGREKHFCLRKGDWDFLQERWTAKDEAKWIHQAKIFECIQRLWDVEGQYTKVLRDPGFLALDLRKVVDQYKSDLSAAGFTHVLSERATFLGLNFWNALTDDLIEIYELDELTPP